MNDFKGVIAATITPFTEKGEFNENVFEHIMRSNICLLYTSDAADE